MTDRNTKVSVKTPLREKPILINRSYVAATVIALVIGAWILSGQFGNDTQPADAASADKTPAAEETLVAVKVRDITATPRQADIIIRGRTEAIRKVEVRAETTGLVTGTPAEKGMYVEQGDILCELAIDARQARLNEAEAVMRQRRLEHEAAVKLAKQGHRSETQAAAARAAFDAAKATYEQAQIELANTKIRAPFAGIVDDRHVDVGDYLRAGEPCAVVVDLDPFLVVGQVSERDVNSLSLDAVGNAVLITGERLKGRIRFIAKSADAATRTFRVELEVPNPEGNLRDGVTAEIHVPVKEVAAHKITPAVLSLDDKGIIGVRIVDEENIVRFVPVEIIADTADGVWITGLPHTARVITVGQEFVVEGQKVDVFVEGDTGASS